MLRVSNLERSIAFYTHQLGMTLHRVEDYPEGRFSLAFLGYDDEHRQAVLELTHNWDERSYEHGTAYGHIALAVEQLELVCELLLASGVTLLRKPNLMAYTSPQRSDREKIAFIADPDGYRIELIEQPIQHNHHDLN